MYIIIEHSGTEESTILANKVSQLLTEDYNATVEQVIGKNESKINVYTENLNKIVSLSVNDSLEKLKYYIDEAQINEWTFSWKKNYTRN